VKKAKPAAGEPAMLLKFWRVFLPARILEKQPAEIAVPFLNESEVAQGRQGVGGQYLLVNDPLDHPSGLPASFGDDSRVGRPDGFKSVYG
jgi:hypothetical protein